MAAIDYWFTQQWQRNSVWQVLLRPLSWLFALLVALRRTLFKRGILASMRVAVPVIVVGNISVGGTGKTPLVIAICALLKDHGFQPGVVSRGYGQAVGNDRVASTLLLPGIARDHIISDETELIAHRAGTPVSVDSNRARAAATLLEAVPSIDVIISDDGLQHYGLQRDVEIVVVDGTRGLGNAAMLPAGPLREPASRLKSVSALVINRTMSKASAISDFSQVTTAPVYSMNFGAERFCRVDGSVELTPAQASAAFAGLRIAAVAGTGNPQRFFLHLTAMGLQIDTRRAFADHHAYQVADFADVEADVIVMTEKDAVKCRAFADQRMWFMAIDALLPESFGQWLLEQLALQKSARRN